MQPPDSPSFSENDAEDDGYGVEETRSAFSVVIPVPLVSQSRSKDKRAWCLCSGVSHALRILVEEHPVFFLTASPVFNERLTPLTRLFSANIMLHWSEGHPLKCPPLCICTLFVRQVCEALSLSSAELSVAYAMIDHLVKQKRAVCRRYTVRPLFIASCCVTVLTCSDDNTTTGTLAHQLKPFFGAVDFDYLDKLVLALLTLLDWVVPSRPDGIRKSKTTIHYQLYADKLTSVSHNADAEITRPINCYALVDDMTWPTT